jgi:beta-galactosidase
MRLWAWQSIFHGAKLLSFFRWRTCPFGSEQHWHGLLDQDDRDNRRLAEARQIGAEARALPPEFFDMPLKKAAAVVRDYDNDINDKRINTHTRQGHNDAREWHAGLSRRHIPADMIWTSNDFAGYSLLVVPHLRIMDEALAKKLRDFASAGGTLILAARSGVYDRRCHVVESPLPGLLRDLAGVEIEDWTMLPDGETRRAVLVNKTAIELNTFVEKLTLVGVDSAASASGRSTATAIAKWKTDDTLLSRGIAITRNAVGGGQVFYIGGYTPAGAIETLLDALLPTAGLSPVVTAGPEIETILRSDGRREFLAVLNHGQEQTVRDVPAGKELFSGKQFDGGKLTLEPFGVALLEIGAESTPPPASSSKHPPAKKSRRKSAAPKANRGKRAK